MKNAVYRFCILLLLFFCYCSMVSNREQGKNVKLCNPVHTRDPLIYFLVYVYISQGPYIYRRFCKYFKMMIWYTSGNVCAVNTKSYLSICIKKIPMTFLLTTWAPSAYSCHPLSIYRMDKKNIHIYQKTWLFRLKILWYLRKSEEDLCMKYLWEIT